MYLGRAFLKREMWWHLTGYLASKTRVDKGKEDRGDKLRQIWVA